MKSCSCTLTTNNYWVFQNHIDFKRAMWRNLKKKDKDDLKYYLSLFRISFLFCRSRSKETNKYYNRWHNQRGKRLKWSSHIPAEYWQYVPLRNTTIEQEATGRVQGDPPQRRLCCSCWEGEGGGRDGWRRWTPKIKVNALSQNRYHCSAVFQWYAKIMFSKQTKLTEKLACCCLANWITTLSEWLIWWVFEDFVRRPQQDDGLLEERKTREKGGVHGRARHWWRWMGRAISELTFPEVMGHVKGYFVHRASMHILLCLYNNQSWREKGWERKRGAHLNCRFSLTGHRGPTYCCVSICQ